MGSLVNGVCYGTNDEALAVYYSDAGHFYTAGSTSYRAWYELSGSTWILKRQSIASNGTITNLANSNAPVITFPSCNQAEGFIDGIAVGWGIAAAMLAAYAWRLMGKATK